MVLDKIFNRKSKSGNLKVVDEKIEEIKNDIASGSADVILRLSDVQEKLRRSKKTLVVEVQEHRS